MAKAPKSADAHLSITAVTEAVIAVMRASSPNGTADTALAARLGTLIRPQLAEALRGPIGSGAELVGQQAFRNILSQHLSGAPAANDEESRRAMRDYLLRNANRSSAEFAALVAQHLLGGGWNGRAPMDVRVDASEGSGSTAGGSYSAMDSRWDASAPYRLSEANWRNSPFSGIPGLSLQTTQSLLAQGFTTPQIIQAGGDVHRLGIHVNDNIARAARLNHEAPGFMPQVHRYAADLAAARKAEGAIAQEEAKLREMEAAGQGQSDAAAALRANITRQREEAEKQRREAEERMNKAIEALPEARKPDGTGIRDAVRAKDEEAAKADKKAENAGRRMESAGASEQRADIKEDRKATDAARLASTTDDLNSPPPPSPGAPLPQTKHAEGHSPSKPIEAAVKTAEAQRQEPSKAGQSNQKVAQAASPRPG
jgi:hypothetical protein